MIKGISRFFTQVVHRFLPDPLIFAIFLTVITFALALGFTPKTPGELVLLWGSGFWNLLAFSMQMAMILVTGHALASSAPMKRAMAALAGAARSPAQATMMVALLAGVACAINWGFGLVLGAMFAREVARRVRGTDYRLLVALRLHGLSHVARRALGLGAARRRHARQSDGKGSGPDSGLADAVHRL